MEKFKHEVALVQNGEVKSILNDAIGLIPSYFYVVPAFMAKFPVTMLRIPIYEDPDGGEHETTYEAIMEGIPDFLRSHVYIVRLQEA